MKTKGIVWALIAVVIGTIYLMMATMGPLKDANLGFGLTSALSQQTLFAGYTMDDLVLFIVFLVVIGLLGVVLFRRSKSKAG